MTREEAKGNLMHAIRWNDIPKKEVLEMAIKALEQEPICPSHGIDCEDCPAYAPCEQAISRQAVLHIPLNLRYDDIINSLPPVNPQPKTGHWIYTDYHTWCCSECGGNPHKGTGFTPNKDGMKMRWKYCNLCGAKMESEEQE